MASMGDSVKNVDNIVESHVAQSCYSVIGDKPFLWSKAKFDSP